MSGLRIMHVIARDLGNISKWSGRDSAYGKSSLCDYAASLNIARLSSGNPVFNAIWFSPFTETTDQETPSKGELKQGSLYGIRNHFRLDPDVTSGNDDNDRDHLRHFCSQAHGNGIKVFGDLVFNHVPIDHPLAIEEQKMVDNLKNPERVFSPAGKLIGLREEGDKNVRYLKFVYNADTLKPVVDGSLEQEWADVAKINYESPAALNCFIKGENGKPGLWKEVIDWFLDSGFDGFRCDAAYKIPQPVWKELIDHTRARNPDAVYIAETLGGSWDDMERNIAGSGFDLCTQGTYYWDIEDDWYRQEALTALKVARGGMGMAETHDVPDSVAAGISRLLRDQFNGMAETKIRQAVEAVCLRDYALSALLGSAVSMEYGFERQLGVASVFREPYLFAQRRKDAAERQDPSHPMNISAGIRSVNEYIEQITDRNDTAVRLDNIKCLGNGVIRYDCTVINHDGDEIIGSQTVFASKQPERGTAFADHCDFLPKDLDKSAHTFTLGGYLAASFTPGAPQFNKNPTVSNHHFLSPQPQ